MNLRNLFSSILTGLPLFRKTRRSQRPVHRRRTVLQVEALETRYAPSGVDADISITPLTAVNEVNTAETFTVTVTATAPAAFGTPIVTVIPMPSTGPTV